MEGTNRRLMFHGMCLFLLGLLTGLPSSISPMCAWDLPHTLKA